MAAQALLNRCPASPHPIGRFSFRIDGFVTHSRALRVGLAPRCPGDKFASFKEYGGDVLITGDRRPMGAFSFVAAAAAPSNDSSINGMEKQSPRAKRKRWQLPPEWEELMTPVPEPPNYLVLATGFCIIYLTRHAIAAELIQWASLIAIMCLTAFHYVKVAAIVFTSRAVQLLKVPLAHVLTLAGWSGLFARDMYRLIVRTTSVWPTLKSLLLATVVLSVAEATKANAVRGQPWAFLIATLIGMAAVSGVIHSSVFVILLFLMGIFALVVQKKDPVSALVPVTALLTGIAEPPVKAVMLVSFIVLCIYENWKNPEEQNMSTSSENIMQPAIMIIVALILGLTVGSRYLHAVNALWLAKLR